MNIVKYQFTLLDTITLTYYIRCVMLNPYQKKKLLTNRKDFLTHQSKMQRNDKPDILEVLDKCVEISMIRKSGRARLYLCPFHNEDTPSFAVYEDTNSYWCFGCGEKGDSFDLIKKTLNMNFVEAKQYAAEQGLY